MWRHDGGVGVRLLKAYYPLVVSLLPSKINLMSYFDILSSSLKHGLMEMGAGQTLLEDDSGWGSSGLETGQT